MLCECKVNVSSVIYIHSFKSNMRHKHDFHDNIILKFHNNSNSPTTDYLIFCSLKIFNPLKTFESHIVTRNDEKDENSPLVGLAGWLQERLGRKSGHPTPGHARLFALYVILRAGNINT